MSARAPAGDEPSAFATGALALALSGFVVAAFAGPFVTVLPAHTVEGWWHWPLLRVLLVIGGSLLVPPAVFLYAPRGRAKAAGVALAVCTGSGLLLSANPILDLVRGPLDTVGRIEDSASWTARVYDRRTNPGRETAHGRLDFQSVSGGQTSFEPVGMQVGRMQDALAGCPRLDGPVRLVGLRHLDVVVAVECVDSPPGPRPR